MVVRASLRLRHFGCVSERLPSDTTMTQVSGERGWDLFVLSAPGSAALQKALAVAESNGERAEVLSTTDEALVFKGRNPPGGIVSEIRASPCWIVWPIVYRDGFELFTLGAPTREDLRRLVARLAPIADVHVERVTDEAAEGAAESVSLGDLVSDLTSRQMEALQLAVRRGYYRSPAAVDSETLAAEFGVSPSTMREHIRKAEAALLARMASLLEERPAAAKRASRKTGRPKRFKA